MVSKNKSFEGSNRKSWQQDSPSASPLRLISLKLKSATINAYQSQPGQFFKDLLNQIDQDDQGRVSAEELLSKLLPTPFSPYKTAAEKHLCRLYKARNVSDLKINPKDLLVLFFYDRNFEKTLNLLKNWNVETKGNFSPEPSFSSSFRAKSSSRQFCYPHTVRSSSQDHLRLVLAWWNELSDGKTQVLAKQVSEFLMKKGFSQNFDECQELVASELQDFWNFEDFLSLFIFPILKNALTEEEKKNNLLKMNKSFLPSYQKIKAQKQRIKFSCFSPLPIKLGYVELKSFRLKRKLLKNDYK